MLQESYALENDWIYAEVASRGAELKKLVYKRNGLNYLWSGDPAAWGRVSPNLFPAIGNIANGGYTYGGEFHPMTKHGFIRDVAFTEVSEERNRLALSYTPDEEREKMYPYRYRFKAVYELVENKLIVNFIVENSDNKTMYFAMGGHTAFSTSLMGGSISDCYLEFETASDLAAHRLNQKTGLIEEKAESFGVNVKRVPLNKKMFETDVYAFRNIVPKAVTLASTKHEHSVKVAYDDYPTLGIWTTPGQGEFLCIEPWTTLPDREKQEKELAAKQDIQVLAPGKRGRYKFSILVH